MAQHRRHNQYPKLNLDQALYALLRRLKAESGRPMIEIARRALVAYARGADHART